MAVIRPEDDRLHARNDDPYWNESSWISFMIPDRGIDGMVYYYHRPNMTHSAGGPVMEPGVILVAHTTDPSWASVLFLSSALVVDIGGALSHAAVVARELGVPCIVNTKVGTSVIRTGDLCRVDGTTGKIDLLERAPH